MQDPETMVGLEPQQYRPCWDPKTVVVEREG